LPVSEFFFRVSTVRRCRRFRASGASSRREYVCDHASHRKIVQNLTLPEEELDRVAHIVRQTLGVYHESSIPEDIEIAPLIESVLKLHSNKIQVKDIHIKTVVENSPPVCGIAGELKQALSNLVSNAIDAVSQGGQIVIISKCIHATDSCALQISIEDDGLGVAPEDLRRVFEPFFTTKKDVGTGLGLWVAKDIVERLGGSLDLRHRSIVTNGLGSAAFVIELPCAVDLAMEESCSD
jgi:signal transduction histidine kinase